VARGLQPFGRPSKLKRIQGKAMERSGTYDDMLGAIGALISLWVGIERMAEKLDNVAPPPTGGPAFPGVSTRLDRWERRVRADAANRPFRALLAWRLREQLLEAQRLRNGICHGLQGIAAANSERPGQIWWSVGGSEHRRTWHELQVHFAWLSKVAFAMGILEEGDMSRFGRLHDTEENREWWRAEYGIDLQPI
jgi:hypothetical protein